MGSPLNLPHSAVLRIGSGARIQTPWRVSLDCRTLFWKPILTMGRPRLCPGSMGNAERPITITPRKTRRKPKEPETVVFGSNPWFWEQGDFR